MGQKVEHISHKITEICFYSLFLLTPLLFAPFNSELFETPKMFFVWALTIIIVGAWIVRSINHGSIIFYRTPLDIPLLIFLVSQFLSFLLSIDRHTSFWGYYGRFNGGILSLTSYALLYWAYVSNMNQKKTIFSIFYLLFSATLVALWGIPAHFGWDPTCLVLGRGLTSGCWTEQFVPTERIFSTLGQPNWLAAWLVAIAPLSWAIIVNLKLLRSTYCILLTTIIFLTIYFTRSQSGFAGLGVALIIFIAGILIIQNHIRSYIKLSFLILISGIIFINYATKIFDPIKTCAQIIFPITNYELPITEITPSWQIRCIVWKGTIDIWQAYPIFGSGPETLTHTYYNFKPPEHNLTSEWDLLYNKAHNEYLNYLANTGVIGLTAYLVLIGAIAISFLKNFQFSILNAQSNHNLKIKKFENSLKIVNCKLIILALTAGWASILVTDFFGFSTVPLQVLFFLFPAIALTINRYESAINPASHIKIHIPTSHLPLLLILVTTFYSLFTISSYYLADINYSQAEKNNNNGEYLKALSHIRQALEKNPREPLYQNELADIASSLAFLVQTEDPTTSRQLTKIAESATDSSLAISPYSVNFWKTRHSVFMRLSVVASGPEGSLARREKAREAAETAARLAPTDARSLYNLGLYYYQNDDPEKAKEVLEKALTLRPNYEEAKQALEELNKNEILK